MKIRIQSVKFKADKKLEEFVTQKVEKTVGLFPGVVGAEVVLKLNNDEERENKVVDIRIEVPGNDLFASKHSSSFEEATVETCDAIRNQIEKLKNKQSN